MMGAEGCVRVAQSQRVDERAAVGGRQRDRTGTPTLLHQNVLRIVLPFNGTTGRLLFA